MLRRWGSFILAGSLIVASSTAALADGKTQQGALAPGGTANVRQAQIMGNDALLWLLGLGVVAGGIVLVVSNNGNGHTSTTTTTAP